LTLLFLALNTFKAQEAELIAPATPDEQLTKIRKIELPFADQLKYVR